MSDMPEDTNAVKARKATVEKKMQTLQNRIDHWTKWVEDEQAKIDKVKTEKIAVWQAELQQLMGLDQ